MGFRWKEFNIKRFYGLDLSTNVVDVMDGFSLDADNVYLSSSGVVSKRPGDEIMFDKDNPFETDSIGTCVLNGTKYYFKFAEGQFFYSLTLTGAVNLAPVFPLNSTVNPIYWTVLDNKLFFVDGLNALRYFDGTSTIKTSAIYARPTAALTGAGGTGYDYTYTIDQGLGESPASSTLLTNKGTGATVTVTDNTGPHTLIVGDKIRIYSKATTVAAASKNVTPTSGAHANGTYGEDASGGYLTITSLAGTYAIATVALTPANGDILPQLYTELGTAVNKTAPVGLVGITKHYGRLVGWKGSTVYNSKVSNPHSWPDDSAQHQAFVYSFGIGDGETITRCITYKDSLYVMKASDIAIFGGIGPDDTGNNAYSFTRLETNGNGCIAGKSAVTIGEKDRLYLVYLSKNGFMATTGSVPVDIGEEIVTQISSKTAATLAKSEAVFDARLGLYLCAVGTPNNRIVWVFDVRASTVAGEQITFGWFPWSKSNVKSLFFDGDRVLFGLYNGVCLSQRVTGTSSDYNDSRQEFFTSNEVNIVNDQITVTEIYTTGDPVKIRTDVLSTLPGGITANQFYYAIHVDDTHISLAATQEDAANGIAIGITNAGSGDSGIGIGTFSIISSVAISAYYVTNWLNFRSPLIVKKLSKPGIVFNAVATNVSLTIQTAYDWIPVFTDSYTFTSTANDPWDGGKAWGEFDWGNGQIAAPINYALPRRKCRSIQFKFSNNSLDQDFSIQALNLPFDYIRNRGNYA